MFTLPDGLSLDITSLLAGVSLAAATGWLASFLALRKDERAVQLDQITKERTKWRGNLRKITGEIVQTYFDNKTQPIPGKVAVLRAKLITSINPKDDEDDKLIMDHFDQLFRGQKADIDVFTRRIALLLKHDWERVKWECTPIYVKVFVRFSSKQRRWRSAEYRNVDN